MRVRYIKSATVVIEHGGKKVLCDPWLTDGIYYGSWFSYPVCEFSAKDFEDVDYIFISHVHPDHCDVETLKNFRKDVPILILDFEEKFLLRTLQRLGFTNIREVPHKGTVEIGPDFKVEILAGDNNDLRRFAIIHGCKEPPSGKTRQIDSLAIFSGGGKVVVNSNDVPLALIAGAFDYIKSKYRTIDFLLVSYAGAGPYPQAYTLEHEAMVRAAVGAAYTSLSFTFQYLAGLQPKFFMPYAGEYILGSRMWWMNKFKGTSEVEELVSDLVPLIKNTTLGSEMVLLNRGEYFDVDNSQASKPYVQTDFMARKRYIERVLSNKRLVYEDAPFACERSDIFNELVQARETLWRKQADYGYYGNVDVYIDIGLEFMYHLSFANKELLRVDRSIPENSSYIHAQIDHRLLRMILDRKANWNNAEIGSHIILSEFYGRKDANSRSYEPMPHFLMPYFQKPSAVLAPNLEVVAK